MTVLRDQENPNSGLLTDGVAEFCRLSLVPAVLGLILSGAAVLKGYEVATEPTPEQNSWTSHAIDIPAVEAEFALGLWLLVGFKPKLARSVSLICFAMFLIAALFQAGSGKSSCGCFGKVEVNPWYTATLLTGA
jgi:hypothetical protein